MLRFLSRRNNRQSNRRPDTRTFRPRLEALEGRALLAGFAQFSGEIAAPKQQDVIPLHIAAEQFTWPGDRVLLGLELAAAPGSSLNPAAVRVSGPAIPDLRTLVRQAQAGELDVEDLRRWIEAKQTAPKTISTRSHLPGNRSVTLASVKPSDLNVRLRGEGRSTGAYELAVYLVGDTSGDYQVDQSDIDVIRQLRGKRYDRQGYVLEADANRNGVINSDDVKLALRNLGAGTEIRPLELTLEFADIDQVTGQVTLRGQTTSGASVQFDQGADRAIDQSTTADGGGIYGFVTTVGAGLTQLWVQASDTFGQRIDVTEEIFRLEVQLDTTPPVSQPIGPDGGTLTTTATDGTTYTLVIPPGAVLSEELVTVTPVAGIPNLPLSDGLIAAAQFGPDGLELLEPATLTIQMPGGVDASQVVGFGYHGTGGDFHLAPAEVNGSTITLEINHFSGSGAGQGTPSVPSLANSFRSEYRTDPRGKFRTALGSGNLALHRSALRSYLQWKQRVDQTAAGLGNRGPAFLALLTPERQEGDSLAVESLHQAITRENDLCAQAPNLNAALGHVDAILARTRDSWWVLASRLGLDTASNGLDYETLREGVCVKVTSGEIDFDRLPNELVARLTVQAGLFFGDQDTVFGPSIQIAVERSSGIEEANFAPKITDSEGNATFFPTPISDDTQVEFDLVATYVTPAGVELLPHRFSVVGHEVRISPSSASLSPGGSQQFTANEEVTWSATGGTITSTGLYTAGNTAGNYNVFGTSVANPGQSGQASVTISGNPLSLAGTYSGQLNTGAPAVVVVTVVGPLAGPFSFSASLSIAGGAVQDQFGGSLREDHSFVEAIGLFQAPFFFPNAKVYTGRFDSNSLTFTWVFMNILTGTISGLPLSFIGTKQ